MWIVELLVVLFFIWLGARLGSIGIGFAGGFGVLVLGVVFGIKPGAIPTDVILIIMGVIAAIAREHPVPLRFIGVGEGLDDLRPFLARDYIDALFD